MGLSRFRSRLGGVLLLLFIPCGVTCSHAAAAPLMPSGDHVTVTFRVMVRQPNSTLPIANATVRDDHRRLAHTDANGYAYLPEETECPLSVRAEAEGFNGFTAETDRLTAAETWTFYLEKR